MKRYLLIFIYINYIKRRTKKNRKTLLLEITPLKKNGLKQKVKTKETNVDLIISF